MSLYLFLNKKMSLFNMLYIEDKFKNVKLIFKQLKNKFKSIKFILKLKKVKFKF